MDKAELQEIDKKAQELVEKAHASLRENPLQATFPGGIRKDVLLGTRFTPSDINYVTNTVTFALVE